uniref:Secreted protein n=1 Tax=Rhipicephalus microplus TaxID=6941 RepID=A0A6M2DB96_RHIMP
MVTALAFVHNILFFLQSCVNCYVNISKHCFNLSGLKEQFFRWRLTVLHINIYIIYKAVSVACYLSKLSLPNRKLLMRKKVSKSAT